MLSTGCSKETTFQTPVLHQGHCHCLATAGARQQPSWSDSQTIEPYITRNDWSPFADYSAQSGVESAPIHKAKQQANYFSASCMQRGSFTHMGQNPGRWPQMNTAASIRESKGEVGTLLVAFAVLLQDCSARPKSCKSRPCKQVGPLLQRPPLKHGQEIDKRTTHSTLFV